MAPRGTAPSLVERGDCCEIAVTCGSNVAWRACHVAHSVGVDVGRRCVAPPARVLLSSVSVSWGVWCVSRGSSLGQLVRCDAVAGAVWWGWGRVRDAREAAPRNSQAAETERSETEREYIERGPRREPDVERRAPEKRSADRVAVWIVVD